MRTSIKWLGLAVAILLLGWGAPCRGGAERRVLYFSQVAGGGHATIPLGRQVLAKLGADAGGFEVDECRDCRQWSPAYFAPYAAIVSFGYGNLPLTDAHKRALLEFVRGGKAFVGIHAAVQMCRERTWPGYVEMLGAAFGGSLVHGPVRIDTEDRFHPATRHLDLSFRVTDDIYRFKNWSRERTHVLLSVHARSLDRRLRAPWPETSDFPVSWCHPHGKGRVFYTVLGHEARVWRSDWFQAHLLHGLLWAMGDHEADVRLGTDLRIIEVRNRIPAVPAGRR